MFQRRRQQNFGVYLLAYQLLNSGFIPPVTLLLIVFQIAVFLEIVPVFASWTLGQICLLPFSILGKREWYRLILPVFMHADDMHLYYNMISLLWKGRRLEPYMGSRRFFFTIFCFVLGTSVMTVAISYLMDEVFRIDGISLMSQCAVGFSGVLFALKVLLNTYFPYGDEYLLGWMPVPSRYACWAELLLIQMITPNASFVGHLAGILVGILYIWGPLERFVSVIDSCFLAAWVILGLFNFTRYNGTDYYENSFHNDFNSRNTYGQRAGYSHQPDPRQTYGWRTYQNQRNFDDYTGGFSEEEQMRQAVEESLRQRANRAPGAPPYPF
ncbi:unnamed protein product [Dracunculus medinensis]|uniref:Rhomboid domain-containing protein n=1 Tax=Dracunculus medinensis TaxID=318479 RepID=A0A0N4UBC4_DRAME|nr:unnamed protein product [Dracunculus medinensis]